MIYPHYVLPTWSGKEWDVSYEDVYEDWRFNHWSNLQGALPDSHGSGNMSSGNNAGPTGWGNCIQMGSPP